MSASASQSSILKAMAESVLLGPLFRLASTDHGRIVHWLKTSVFLRSMTRLCGQVPAVAVPGSRFAQPISVILLLGSLVLLTTFTVLDTGPIGALTWALFLLSILHGWLTGCAVLKRPTVVDLLVFGFVLSAVVSTAFSSFMATSVVGLAKMLTFLAGYLLFRSLLAMPPVRLGRFTVQPLWMLLIWLLGLAVIESLIGFYQYINHIQPLATWEDPTVNPELKMNRIFGTLKPSNPNLLAGFLIPSLATAGGLALIALVKRRWMATLGLLGVTVMVLAALVLTGSRGGYLSLGAMGLGFFALCGHLIWYDPILKLTRRLKTIWILMLVGAVALGGLALAVSPSLQHRVGSIFAMREDSSNAYRMNVYASAVQMFQDNPVVGIGPGNGTFKLVYGLYMVPGYNALGAYSVPLEIAVEQGLVGLLIFLTLLATLKIRALLLVDSQQPLPQKLLGVLLFCGVVGSIVYGIFDTIWYRPAVNLTFWLFVAALAQQTELLFDRRETKMPQEVPHANS